VESLRPYGTGTNIIALRWELDTFAIDSLIEMIIETTSGSSMKMMKYLAPALFASFFAIAPASAMPASSTTGLDRAAASSIVHVQYHGHHHSDRHYDRHRARGPVYRPGGRYSSAPRGYRRYGARPYDWRARRCVMVGPVWFCP